ncbi:heme ABC transporter ATP-binding protein [Haloarcula onubensis]|uniref:Heme ABC transporter ATP-binding protein n=1 Tax=Haloarcula onubensis TaxID=2950539 RepID=A0ABU2FTS7_9EURY|nr:heme ABC transporter ATP-binding protein [Halomicroarcula sp. S3CR25-11]MDS0283661.1 heme ABC transporter ATP-binding protein [Halomicroarcula sp. S3CR25-11]
MSRSGQGHDGEPIPMLEAADISVSLGGTRILSDVSLTAECGAVVGLVGPNGAGKTTTLRVLRATLSPDSGSVRVAGDPIDGLSSKQVSQRVASTPQATTLSFDFTVRQTVEMGRTPHLGRFERADSDDADAVDAAMERADVARFADRPVTSLSGGERQRVVLARALAQETPVLLLDEPTSNLDINHAVNTLELVAALAREGKTAVAAIHDLNLAARYCDELVLLADGEVRAAGEPREVLQSGTLADAFDAETLVTGQPGADAPLVTPLPDRESVDRTVHVVGTGGQAAAALARLVAAGATVSVGVVPAGDAAAERARDLDCQVVTVPPFAGVDGDSRQRATELARGADAVVVAGDVGDANESVVAAAERVVAVDGEGVPAIESPRTTVATVETLRDAVAGLPTDGELPREDRRVESREGQNR